MGLPHQLQKTCRPVNDPPCLPFGKGSFVKSPIRLTTAVGGYSNEGSQSLGIWCEDDRLPLLISVDRSRGGVYKTDMF